MLYVDTPVLVSALTRELDTNRSQAWLAKQEPSELTIRDWTVTEIASAMSIKSRAGSLGADHCAAALAEFTRLSAESLRVLPVARENFQAAARYAAQSQLSLRAGDPLHLAICADHGAKLCTLDRRMADAALQVGVESSLLSQRKG